MTCLADIDVAILCGGKGTRAQSYLGNTPKVLAPFAGRPFIEHHIDYLREYGAKRIILLAGHGHDQVNDWLTQHPIPDVLLVKESKLQGGGRALQDAIGVFLTYNVLITNGDTLLIGDLNQVIPKLKAHYQYIPSVLTVGGKSTGMCLGVVDLIRDGIFLALPVEAMFGFSFIDFGTPEGYRSALEHFNDHHEDAISH